MPVIDHQRMMRRADFDVVVGLNLRRLREQHGMSQAALAERSDMSASQISRLEQGQRTLDLWQAIKFTNIFHCKIEQLTAQFG